MLNCSMNCPSCPSFVSTTAITQLGSQLFLVINPTTNLFNNERICVQFAQNVPNLIGIPSVVIQVAGINYPVIETQTCGAHLLYSDQLKQCNCGIANRQRLSLIYSADLKVFTYIGCRRLCKTNAIATIARSNTLNSAEITNKKAKKDNESLVLNDIEVTL